MKVYFSAPSTLFFEDDSRREYIVSSIEKSGGELIHDWIQEKDNSSAQDLFQKTVDDIKKSNVLIAEITYPSTGVGQQIAMALSWKIPVIALKCEEENYSSKFTVGTKSPYLTILKYNSHNLPNKLSDFFSKISSNKFIKFNFVTTREIYDFLEKESASKEISKSELLRKIVDDWIKHKM